MYGIQIPKDTNRLQQINDDIRQTTQSQSITVPI